MFFNIIIAAGAAYLIISGIRGKGKLFEIQNAKEGCREKLVKWLRILYIIVGIAMLFNTLGSIVSTYAYEYVETQAATETTQAVYELQQKADLGSFSFLTYNVLRIVSLTAFGISIAALVAVFILFNKMTDRNAPKKAANQGGKEQAQGYQTKTGEFMPASAFDFDEPKSNGQAQGEPKN